MGETIKVKDVMVLSEMTMSGVFNWIRRGRLRPVTPLKMLGSRPRYEFLTSEVIDLLVAKGYKREELENKLAQPA